jgi:hypothetical protein
MISISITPEAFEAIRATLPHSDAPLSRRALTRDQVWLDATVLAATLRDSTSIQF